MTDNLKNHSQPEARVDLLVIGAGAAGLMAAGQAASKGARVRVLERMDRPARKLRITGKGRCNFTNIADKEPFLKSFQQGDKFLRSSFSRFFNRDLIQFFESIDVPSVEERGGRVFPASQKGQDLVDALVNWCRKQGVQFVTGVRAVSLNLSDQRVTGVVYRPSGIDTSQKDRLQKAKSVLITTGGASYPATGSSGDGYSLAAQAGHGLNSIYPALVPLETGGETASRLQGLSLVNIGCRIYIENTCAAAYFGELLFTHFGVSGPIVLSASALAVKALQAGKEVRLALDFKPALDHKQLDQRLQRDLLNRGRQQMSNLLRGLLPQTLIPVCLEQTGIPPDRTGNRLTAQERKTLRVWLKDFRLEISGHRSFDEAIITAGGIPLKEIDPKTMASKRIKGLYCAGEILDIHADTGGYNLQAAFSTGWTAGRAAAEAIRGKSKLEI